MTDAIRSDLLEMGFLAKIHVEELEADLTRLRNEFESSPEVMTIKRQIGCYQEQRSQCIKQAQEAGIETQGSFVLKQRTRKNRTVVPWKFAEKFGMDRFCKVANIPVGAAEDEVGKKELEDVCLTEVKILGVTIEYVSLMKDGEHGTPGGDAR